MLGVKTLYSLLCGESIMHKKVYFHFDNAWVGGGAGIPYSKSFLLRFPNSYNTLIHIDIAQKCLNLIYILLTGPDTKQQ